MASEEGKHSHGEKLFSTSAEEISSGDWIKTQKKTFTKWCNFYLKTHGEKIDDLYQDLRDGTKLIRILEIISKDSMPRKYKKDPKMRIHMLENQKTAFEFMREKGLMLTNVGGSDIADGNEKITLGLIWSIVSRFEVADILLDGVSGKEGLLLWCQRQTMKYENVNVKDFSKSWQNGLALCALVHRYRPDAIAYEKLDASNAMENVDLALRLAQECFGIEPLFDPEDLAEAARPDEKIVITYVSLFFKAFAAFAKAEGLVKGISKAIAITRRHDSWISDYVEGATEMKTWIGTQVERLSSREHGTTTESIKSTLESFYEYQASEKPAYGAKSATLKGIYSTLAASGRNNKRPSYAPEAGLGVEDIEGDWGTLEATEAAYEADVRATYTLFQQLDNTRARFDLMMIQLTGWISARSIVFESGDYGNSRTAVETLLDAYHAYEAHLKHYREVCGVLDGYAREGGMERHEGQAAMLEQLAAAQEQLAALETSGAAYHAQLLASVEKHKQLAIIQKVEAWMDTQMAVFTGGEHGNSVTAAQDLIDTLEKGFDVQIAPKEATLVIESADEEVVARLAEAAAKLASTKEAAEAYRAALYNSLEKHKQLFALQKLESWLDAQLVVFSAEDYGATMVLTETLQDSFKEYQAVSEVNKGVLEMEPVDEEVLARHTEVAGKFTDCETAAATYSANLEAAMELHVHIAELTKTYNSKATEFVFGVEDLDQELSEPVLSDSVEAVEAMIEKFTSKVQTTMYGLTDLYNEINALATELIEREASEEAFARYTIHDLYDRHQGVADKLAARETELNELLEAEKSKESLRVDFADKAEAIAAYCKDKEAAVAAVDGSLEEQLAQVTEMRTEYDGKAAEVEALEAAAAGLAELGVVNNPHTSETVYSIRAVWAELPKVLDRAVESLQGQILAEKSGQITPEQLQEIREVFEFFDVDRDAVLNLSEFHSCITGIGVALSTEEVEAKHAELDTSGDGTVNFEEFASFMVAQLKESGTSEAEVLTAFEGLAGGRSVITDVEVKQYFQEAEVRDYVLANLTEVEGGYDYGAFVASQFAR